MSTLYDKLKAYSESGVYPFHMPGHKRTAFDGLPYGIDITEIGGFDDLHEPTGCLRELQKTAAELFGSRYAFALVNGSTVGILAAVRAMTESGGKALLARNCHLSVYHAAELCRLDTKYLYPDCVDGTGICASIAPEDVEEELSSDPDVSLVVITSPTYEGVVSDIKSISEICHSYGAKLLVDEAHGAHFAFSDNFPLTAIQCGADAAAVSLHKTLPAMTQTALLLVNDEEISQKVKRELSVFETSSPSYVLLASIDRCVEFIKHSGEAFDDYTKRLDSFYASALSLKHLSIAYDRLKGSDKVYDFDIGKICILCSGYMTGRELMDALRSEYKLELEMARGDCALAMTSVCDADEGFERLLSALTQIDGRLKDADHPRTAGVCPPLQKRYTISEAVEKHGKKLDIYDSIGMVSREYIRVYPPGVPIIVPGEVISSAVLSRLREYEAAGNEILSDSSAFPFISIIG